jgi:hypothetical protein
MSIPLLGLIGGDSQLTNVLRNASGPISGMCAAPLTFSDDRQHDSEIVTAITIRVTIKGSTELFEQAQRRFG